MTLDDLNLDLGTLGPLLPQIGGRQTPGETPGVS